MLCRLSDHSEYSRRNIMIFGARFEESSVPGQVSPFHRQAIRPNQLKRFDLRRAVIRDAFELAADAEIEDIHSGRLGFS